jgi:histidine phosphotransferase ChpT
MQIDIRVMEMLSSKLCHDLVSPVSAINNGVELIEDIGGSVVDEAMKLIGNSAIQAARRLRLFRMAYGRAGTDESLTPKEVKNVAEQYLSGGKVTLNWSDDQPLGRLGETRGYLKTMLNLIILSEEVLAYGGMVSLRSATIGDHDGCRLEIIGRNAQLTPALQGAIDGTQSVDELTPRSIQAYISGRFAEHFGLKLGFDQSLPDRLDIILAAPPLIVVETSSAMDQDPAPDLLPPDIS